MQNQHTILNGDAIDQLKTLADESINCCVTSPPYWGLRDYGVEGQLGLEKDYKEYIQKLVLIFREVRRVLKKDGTLWLNLGDCFAKKNMGHIRPKEMMGIPWRVAFSLQEDGWRLRSDIIWEKSNAVPEPVKDRPTRSHEYIFLLTKESDYYYDHESIKENAVSGHVSGNDFKREARLSYNNKDGTPRGNDKQWDNIGGKRNKRSVWNVSVKPFKETHFATFSEDLILPCVLAGCPEKGIVLDPFLGSGTTLVVAKKNNRSGIGVELNPEYIKIADKRLKETKDSFLF